MFTIQLKVSSPQLSPKLSIFSTKILASTQKTTAHVNCGSNNFYLYSFIYIYAQHIKLKCAKIGREEIDFKPLKGFLFFILCMHIFWEAPTSITKRFKGTDWGRWSRGRMYVIPLNGTKCLHKNLCWIMLITLMLRFLCSDDAKRENFFYVGCFVDKRIKSHETEIFFVCCWKILMKIFWKGIFGTFFLRRSLWTLFSGRLFEFEQC